MQKILPAILGWILVIIVLSMAPTIAGYNTNISTNVTAATNASYMVGMTTVVSFGGFLAIIALLLSTGVFAWSATTTKAATTTDIVWMVGDIILVVITFSVFSGTLVSKFDALITAGSVGFEKTAYGFFPILTYLAMISSTAGIAAWKSASMFSRKKGKKAINANPM